MQTQISKQEAIDEFRTIENISELEAENARLAVEVVAKREFAASFALRTEFGNDEKAFVAFRVAASRGLVRNTKKQVERDIAAAVPANRTNNCTAAINNFSEPVARKPELLERTAPETAFTFPETTSLCFIEAAGKNSNFRIVGYSGQVIKNHWYWGNLAFDLSGIKFDKTKIPILEEHDREKRIGFTTRQQISDNVIIEGTFLSNEDADRIRADIAAGFPMSASLFCKPDLLERVEQGKTVLVNGQTLSGPGTVFRKSTIFEVSLCTLGADSGTSAEIFAAGSSQQLARSEVGLFKQWQAEFAASKDLRAEFGGDLTAYLAYMKADSQGLVGPARKKTK